MNSLIKTRVEGLWANNLPLSDDDKTHGVIYAWIKVKLQRSSPLTHASQINNRYSMKHMNMYANDGDKNMLNSFSPICKTKHICINTNLTPP